MQDVGGVERHVRGEALAQGLPFEQLHDQKRPGVAVHTKIVHTHDVGVGETGGLPVQPAASAALNSRSATRLVPRTRSLIG